jgi:hypothetical protein
MKSELDILDRAAFVSLTGIFGSSGEIKLRRVDKNQYCAYSWITSTIDIYNPLTTSCDAGTLGHELAHQWDFRQHISGPFAEYVGAHVVRLISSRGQVRLIYYVGSEKPPIYGSGNPPNAFEDFAESLAEFVYQQGWHNEGIEQGKKRWVFVENLLHNGTILSDGNSIQTSTQSPTPTPYPTPDPINSPVYIFDC